MKKILFTLVLICILATLFVAMPVSAAPGKAPGYIRVDTNNPPAQITPSIAVPPPPYLQYVWIKMRDGSEWIKYVGEPGGLQVSPP